MNRKSINGKAFDLEPLTKELRAFGEGAVADWLIGIDDVVHDEISEKAIMASDELDFESLERESRDPESTNRRYPASSSPS